MTLENTQQIRTLCGISLDTSASMRGITKSAAKDYNQLISGIKDSAIQNAQDVIVSVVECGAGQTDRVARKIVNSAVTVLQPMAESAYVADGRGTPLYDSVGELIDIFQSSSYANDPNTSFLVMIITDGGENASRTWGARALGQKIRELQATDRWTFSFRVPRGYARQLVNDLGLYEGNIVEWEQTTKGMEQSTQATSVALNSYFTARSQGVTSTRSFYASMKDVKIEDVKAQLVDISNQVTRWTVQTVAEGSNIRDFVEHKTGAKFLKGSAFYKLVSGKKSADKVQASKLILIRDKNTGVIYHGDAARDLIGLSRYSDSKVRPGSLGQWEIFIQSTSTNRVLPVNSEIIFWPQVGIAYKSGISS